MSLAGLKNKNVIVLYNNGAKKEGILRKYKAYFLVDKFKFTRFHVQKLNNNIIILNKKYIF